MNGLYTTPSESQDIRQGDIIFRKTRTEQTYGLVITADCDIAKGKHGNHYTWIKVIPTAEYLEKNWAPTEIKKIQSKQSKTALEYVNKKLREQDLNALSEETMISWLTETGVNQFITKLGIQECPPEILNIITGLYKISEPSETSSIDKIRTAAAFFKLKIENIALNAQQNLKKGDDGFPDFFCLPGLCGELENGCVALLRHIYSTQDETIYTCEANAKIDGNPNSFYRMCRLNDRVKYSIVQKTTFLFSRIGMTTEFEEHTENVVKQNSDKIFEEAA